MKSKKINVVVSNNSDINIKEILEGVLNVEWKSNENGFSKGEAEKK